MYAVAPDNAVTVITMYHATAGILVHVRPVALAVAPYAFLNGAVGPNAASPPVLLPLSEPPSVLAATRPYSSTKSMGVAEFTCESPGVVAIVVRPAHQYPISPPPPRHCSVTKGVPSVPAETGLLSIPKITLHTVVPTQLCPKRSRSVTVVYLERVAAGIQALPPAVHEVVRVAPLLCHSDTKVARKGDTKVGRKGATKVGAKSAPDAAAPPRRYT